MKPLGRLALCSLALAAGSVAALAQTAVISARSGLIHYVEGQVYLAGQEMDNQLGSFPEVKENQELRTEEGRAEILLTPGVFLRIGENSAFRMVTNRLIDTRLEFLSGSAIIEAEGAQKDNSVTVVFRDATIHVAKKGLYRFDSSPAELRVFDGVAEVTSADRTLEVKEGHLIALDTLAMRKFDRSVTDAFNRWSERRAQYVSMANVSAASSLRATMYSSDYGTGSPLGYGTGMFNGGWYFNPFFGMYTFVPGMGMGYSPYGYAYWSPFSVYQAYMPGYYYNPGAYGYGGAYSNSGYRTVPSATHNGSTVAGSPGSVAVAHAPSHSSGGFTGNGGSIASGSGHSTASGTISAPISHGGGSVVTHR